MLISPIKYNYDKAKQPSFQSLKIDYAGLYKKDKFAEHAKMVVNSIKDNEIFTDFCKNRDVEVSFSAYKAGGTITTYFDMVVVKPVKSKLSKLLGLNRKNIVSIEKERFINNLTDDITENFSKNLWHCSNDLSNELSEYNGKTYGKLTRKIREINKNNKESIELRKTINDVIEKCK